MNNSFGLSWENVDLAPVLSNHNRVCVRMNNPEEARAFRDALSEYVARHDGFSFRNEDAWKYENFLRFTAPDNAMDISVIHSTSFGLYWGDVLYYQREGRKVIDFSELYADAEISESENPLEFLWG